MRRMLLAGVCGTLLGCLLATNVWAQGAIQQPVQWANPMGQSLYLLLAPQIQQELEIVPEQKDKLIALQKDSQTKMMEAYKTIGEVPAEERMTKYNDVMRTLGDEVDKQVQDILLPQQIRRVKQISLQMRLQQMGYGMAGALHSEDLAKELAITNEQKEQLKQKEVEIRKEIQDKTKEFYEKLQHDSREKIFGVLTEDQRRKLDALIGEKFTWQQQVWQGQPAQGGAGGVRVIEKK